MRKIFIEDSRVRSFLVDLAAKLDASIFETCGEEITDLCIVGIGQSGTHIAQFFFENLASASHPNLSRKKIKIVEVDSTALPKHDDATLHGVTLNGARFDVDEFLKAHPNAAFLITDGVTRSGRTMTAAYRAISSYTKHVWCYSVAVSVGSNFVPT